MDKEEQFEDILCDRRVTSDLGWALKTWDVPACQYTQKRTPMEIRQQVLNDCIRKKDKYRINGVMSESDIDIEEKAKEILNEMSHNFQLRTIRFFGYVLSKFMKSVYGKILVNKEGIAKISAISTQYPIVYLPTHRSYSDFLLVSYVCFYYNLPLPVIAAGLDFLGLKYLSFLLRGAGAFFIRRSFVGDQLYKDIFSAYVQTHIEGAEFPLEFFIEGTRSRTAKSLVPKLGMLQVILELFFSSKVPDVTIVPISITYDRTLEETLYAYELLGVPKPKESTKGLIKARKVMSDYFGNVYMKFGEPISLKEYFHSYNRSIHNLHPRDLSVTLKKEQILCADLANNVIHMQQRNLVLSPFPLICLVISHYRSHAVHVETLINHLSWMQELIKNSGASIYTGNSDFSESLHEQLKIHSNILTLSEDGHIMFKNETVRHPESSVKVSRLQEDIINCAIPAMFSYHYGNQALQLLVHDCMVALAMLSDEGNVLLKSDVFLRYEILRKLLRREFVFERDSSAKDFSDAVDSLRTVNIVTVDGLKLLPVEYNFDKLEFLSELLLPFLQSYQVISSHLVQTGNKINADVKKLSIECQAEIENAILEGYLNDYRCLSLDIVNNCITFLVNEGALSKISENNKMSMVVCHSSLTNILVDLELFLPQRKRHSNVQDRISLPSAKL